jgi:hypothetical protein
MAYKRDLASPLASTFGDDKPKRKKTKTINLKEVKVESVGRYTDKKQSMSKAKKQAKNFSKNESTGYAAKVTPKKVKTITYKDGKKVKTTVAKDDNVVKEKGKEVRVERREARKENRQKKRQEKKDVRQSKRKK